MTTKLLTVEVEPEKYMITVDAAKQTGKTKELKPNSIDTNLYCQNTKTCGFTSVKPFEWLRLFEKVYNEHKNSNVSGTECQTMKVCIQMYNCQFST